MRALHIDLWSMLAWRSIFAALALALLVVVRQRRESGRALRSLGTPGLIAIPISAFSMFCYVASLKLTTVANVMTVYATVPFVAAGIAYVWSGERATRRVLFASLIAFTGICIMAGSATRPADMLGNVLAFLMTVTFSTVLVMARRHPSINMAPVNAIAALVCAAACIPLMTLVLPSPVELVILAGFGFTTTALAYLLFLTGGRYIPSSEAGLLGMLDVVLGPLWVWLAFSEEPGRAALIGGAFVLAAVAWYLAAELRERGASQPA